MRMLEQRVAVHEERLLAMKEALSMNEIVHGELRRAIREISDMMQLHDKRIDALTLKLGFVIVIATGVANFAFKIFF